MRRFKEYVGLAFGRLMVLEEVTTLRTQRDRYYRCRCECGKALLVSRTNLRNGHSRSCGCLSRQRTAERNTKHGLSNSVEYRAWQAMRNRCFNKNIPAYKDYGARGITVCPEWRESFLAFYAHMGQRPRDGVSIDRIDNDGHYEPGNVRWATRSQQAVNRRAVDTCRKCGGPLDYVKPSGGRCCRACKRAYLREWRARA